MTDEIAPGVPGTDIAVVGMAGRFPGAADVAGLWETIRAGRSGLTRFTAAELRAAGVPEERLNDPDFVPVGGVLEGIDRFDAGFFGFNPKEAQILDPQHRLFLETSWHALEDASCDPARFEGSVGVFGGCAISTYWTSNLRPAGAEESLGAMAVGLANDKDSLTLRVAHTLGLAGPAYAVQSYCSTSLVAVCAAATSLANFECDLALAGGVAIAVPDRTGYVYQPGGIASPDGETRAFDASGQGSLIGNGVGVVALRRLEDALADGDRVYAVIRGWAVNNDAGRKVGFTAPGVQGQAAVVAEALGAAGLDPADIDYIEAHGTGTALGDAAELAALQQVFRGQEVRIGSVKTNLGHLDRAAGVTGLIKAVLALHHGEIPATLNHSTPNAQLESGEARLTVVTERTPWQRGERVRRAGVSAFGIGGTNAHVVLEEAPPVAATPADGAPEVLVWSARTAEAADALTARLAAHLGGQDASLADTAFTLQTGRRVFEHRRALVAADRAAAAAALDEAEVFGRTDATSDRRVAFLIAGTGEHYEGMAAELYATQPVFREVLDECRAVLAEVSDEDLLAEMLRPRQAQGGGDLSLLMGRGGSVGGGSGDATDRLQPALFVVEYALARLVQSWGVHPSVMVGYSLGEYVAAALSGVLSTADAVKLVAHRAKLIHTLPAGAMAAVPLAADAVRSRIAAARITGLDVAALNGPEITVVSGTPQALAAFEDVLRRQSVPLRRLATTHAFHSHMLEPARAGLTAWITENVRLQAPRIPYVSNVTGELITDAQAQDPGYWAEHMCGPVRFDAALSTLLAQGEQALLEIGPGQSLAAMARGHRRCPRERWSLFGASLPGSGDPRGAAAVQADTLARLWLAGVPVDWAAYRGERAARRTGVPGYPFQRERHWIDAPAPAAAAAPPAQPITARQADPAGIPAAGARVELMAQQWIADTVSAGDAAHGSFTLVADGGGVAEALAGLLRADGGEVRVVRPAEISAAARGSAATTVVHLASLDWDRAEADEAAAVLSAARTVAAWGESGAEVRLLLATRGGQAATEGERPVPAQAAVAALAVVAGQEYLSLDAAGTDLDPAQGPDAAARALADELRRPAAETVHSAYRDGRRLVPGYVCAEDGGQPAAPVRPGGTYLLTGGLSDVGLTLAAHLARGGAGRLILASRGGAPQDPDGARAAAVGRLRELGAEVLTPALDVTDAAALGALFAEQSVDGVVHLAADTSESTFVPLRDADETLLRRQFSAKVGGARALAAVIAALPAPRAPRWCAVFSSTSAVLGGIAFGGYGAANAALTAVALGADGAADAGTRWTSAAWDTWSATLARLDARRGATMLAHAMTDPDALAAFDRAIGGARRSVVVAAGGLQDRLPGSAAPAAPGTAASGAGDNHPRPDLPQPYVPPLTATERLLAALWTEVLGVEPVGTRDNFFDLGGNSLLGLQMLAHVKKRTGIVLPSVALFESPTVHALARTLDERGAATAAAAPAAPPSPATPAAPAAPAAPLATVPAQRSAPPQHPRPQPPRPPHTDDDRRIAIVGMAGRFPGAADVSAFWANLCGGVEAVRFFSEQELLDAGVAPELIRDPAYVPARPVLDDIAGFDAGFFGLSPRMAALTDPQQRLFLEVCWEALEQSGYCVPEHRGRVGVYGGANISTYLLGLTEQVMSDEDISAYEIIMGNDKDALTTTVSYLFDLHGPSVAVQTFCSTSLVATHLAVQALRAGECELAMAGGVSVRVPDRIGHLHTPGGQESPDGHVRAFDAQARGSMFGDGAAVVVLKRLSDALRDGDHVWGVIRGSAMNNDGALKAGYTAPSVVGQSRVIADAMADAGVTAEDIGYIEAHGTGTVLGDPIEVAALTRAFGPTERRQYCPIGSVKPNVGHLDRAAGATGLIKTALALREQVIPPTLHYTAPNPEIDFANSPFYVNARLSPWPAPESGARIAGLNSLGMGGTNVHVVVEEPPAGRARRAADPLTSRRYHVLPLSGGTAAAADAACARLAEHLTQNPATRLADAAFTLQIGRKTLEHRRAAVAASTAEAAAILGGAPGAPVPAARVEAARGRPAAFHFGPCDTEAPAAVGELYRREPAFRAALDAAIDALGDALAEGAGGPVREALRGTDIRALLCWSDAPAAQPAAVARVLRTVLDLAFAATLADWGVRPAAVSGSGVGRVAADCVGGRLTARDALALAVRLASGESSELDDVARPPADPDAVTVYFGTAPAGRGALTTAVLPQPGDPRPGDAVLTGCLAELWLAGADVDWAAYHGRRAGEPAGPDAPGRIPLPTYPFQRRRYWIERQARPAAAAAGAPAPTSLQDIDDLPLLPEQEWLNLPVWRQTAGTAPARDQPASWLVFAGGGAGEGVLAGLAAAAESGGARVTAVRPGDAFGRDAAGYTIRPGSIEDALSLLRSLDGAGTVLDRVVHLWNLGVEPGDEAAALSRGLHTLVAFARAAGEEGYGGWSLDIVAPGAHAVLGGAEARPEAATLIGPALVIPLEYPSVATRLIDVEPAARPADVLAELRRASAGPTVALRGGRRYLRGYEVLEPAPAEQAAAVLRENGVYLITGGLGGIGLAMAHRLAREVRARLVLLGRSALPPRERWEAVASGAEHADEHTRSRVERVLELLALGAEVEIVVGDVAEPEDVRRAVGLARERFGALHGVLHAAGVPGIGLIQFKQPEDCDVVLAPKVDGARALAEALRLGEPDEAELDFLALFSSITSATGGGPGQVDYCAANAYLDALAARLAADGRRVVAIAWGEWTWNAWQEGLSGYDDALQAFFRQHRERFGIGFEEGWRTLLRALAAAEPGVVVSTQNLPVIAEYAGLFNVETVTAPAAAGAAGPRYPRPELLTPYREPQDPAQQRIAAAWCETLKLERVGVDDNFFELGGNSLLGIPLLGELRADYPGAKLPPHILYEAPTVAALARIVAPAADADPAPADAEAVVLAQAELRRSGVKAAAARRRRP